MIFKRKKEEVPVDDRTEVERKFEQRGQEIGAKTGKVVQQTIDKINQTKTKLSESETLKKAQVKSKNTLEKSKSKLRETKTKVLKKDNTE